MHHEECPQGCPVADDKGIALLVALAIVAILAVVVLDFSYSVRVDMHIAANFRDRLIAMEAAKAGVHYGIYMLRQDSPGRDDLQEEWAQPFGIVLDKTDPLEIAEQTELTEEEVGLEKHEDFLSRQKEGNVATASIAICDEERKIGVNFLAGQGAKPMYREWIRTLIDNLQERSGFADVDAYELVENIADWIDNDDIGDAESHYYEEELLEPYSCRNGPMESIYELKLVKGMIDLIFFGNTPYPMQLSGLEEDQWDEREQLGYTLPETAPWEREEDPEAIYGLVNFLTAHSTGRINLNTAPREILEVILGNDETRADDVILAREEAPLQSKEIQGIIGPDLYTLLGRGSLITFRSTYFRIESTGKFHKAAVKVIAIVSRSNTRDVAIHYWRVEDVRSESSSEDIAWTNVM